MDIAFAAVVTRDLLAEYRLFRASFRIYNRCEPRSVVHCDAAAYEELRAMPETIAIPAVAESRRPVSQWSAEFRDIVRHKMLVIDDAWRLLSPAAVAYVDADMVATAPFLPMLAGFRTALTLSPHFWPHEAERRSAEYGFYNSGLILARDRAFAGWWRSVFESRPATFADQQCLNDASTAFDIAMFPEPWNIGYWRRRSRRDVPPVPPDAITFHAHVFAPPRDVNEFEVGQKQFVAAALDMLAARDLPEDRQLLAAVREIGDEELITQNYRPRPAACSCSASRTIRSIRRGGRGSGADICSSSTSAAISSGRAGTSTI
jgi:hypothetical protein